MTQETPPRIIERLVQRAQQLYSLPGVALKVIELTNQPDVSAAALKDCIELDPALSGKVLRVVNSSLFGLRGEVSDLNQALALLGIRPLKLLVLGFSLPDELLSGVAKDVLERYWRHTLIKAVAARQVSEHVFDASGDEAFLAGLLQEIGVLVLIQGLGEPYIQFLESVERDGGELSSLELATLGFDHAVLSARLLDHWGLPETLVAAVATPHDEATILDLQPERRRLPQTLHLAELIARLLTSEEADLLDRLLVIGQLYGDLSRPQLESLIALLNKQVPQLAEILSLQLPAHTDYSTVLQTAYEQLAMVAEQAVMEPAAKGANVPPTEARRLSQCVERLVGEPMYSDTPEGGRRSTNADPTSAAVVSVEPHLAAHVESAVSASRQARRGLSLMLVEIDHFATQLLVRSPKGAVRVVRRLQSVIEQVLDHDGQTVYLENGRFALILPQYERQSAVDLARRLISSVHDGSLGETQPGPAALSISAGLATLAVPPKNFPAPELIEAAQRCLSGAQLSGGDSVKSIDLC